MPTFGNRYFGRRFWGDRFFGDGGSESPPPPPPPALPLITLAGEITDRTSCILNGVDLALLGVVIEDTDGIWSGPAIREGHTAIPRRAGHMWNGSVEAEPRTITITGWIRGRTRDELVERADLLQSIVDQGMLEAIFVDFATVVFFARRAFLRIGIARPQKRSRAGRIELTLEGQDALAHEISDRVYAIGNFQTPIPLGTGPSAPIIRAFGPGANPRAKYRSITGEIISELGFTIALDADQYIESNCNTMQSLLYSAGDDPIAIEPDDDCDYFVLDPRDGRARSGHWPTVQQNLAGEVQLRRTWL